MTVSSTQSHVSYDATGASGESFPIPFYFIADTDLEFYSVDQTTGEVTEYTLNTDYTVTGAGVPGGGTLTVIGALLTAGDQANIQRWLTARQDTGYPPVDDFPATVVERDLDRCIMLIQQLLERTGGASFNAGLEYLGRDATNVNLWDAEDDRIGSVADPTSAQDAATKAYVDGIVVSSGNMPTPSDPADDGKILVASGGGATWRDQAVPDPAAADLILTSTASGEGNYGWATPDTGLNYILNGDFRIAQRGASFTAASTPANADDTYLLDRWVLLSDGNDIVDVSQDLTVKPDNVSSAIKLDVQTPSKKFGLVQIIEAADTAALVGQTVSLSFKARTTTGAIIENIRVAVLSWTGSPDAVTSDVVSAWNAEGVDPTWATNWTAENTPSNSGVSIDAFGEITVEGIDIDTSGVENIAIVVWVDDTDAAINDLLYLTAFRLNPGTTAFPFTPRPFALEHALCERFYFQTYEDSVAVGTATDIGAESFEAAGTTGGRRIGFPVAMRAAPTVSFWSIAGVADEGKAFGSAATCSVAERDVGKKSITYTYGTPTNANDNTTYGFHIAADAEL